MLSSNPSFQIGFMKWSFSPSPALTSEMLQMLKLNCTTVQFHNKWLSRWKARVGSFRTKSLGLGQKWNLWSDLQWFPHWTHLFGAFGRLWSRRNWGKVNGAELSEIKFFKISGDLFKRTGWVVGDLRRRIMEEDKFESSFAFWLTIFNRASLSV